MLQAWTSDRASRHSADLQREHDQVRGYFLVFVQLFEKYGTLIERYTALIEKVCALTQQARDRQVEQGRTQAQILRTERWVDDCCTPVSRAIMEYCGARMRFGAYCRTHCTLSFEQRFRWSADTVVRRLAVTATATKLETTQPAAFAELYKEYSMKHLDVKPDGTIHAFGQLALDPTIDRTGLTFGANSTITSIGAGSSPASLDVRSEDVLATLKYPYIRELPEAFYHVMAADLDAPLAKDYRGYIRHEVKPILDRIKDILHAHYAAIEAPPLTWLIEMFPESGKQTTVNAIPNGMIVYARAWNRVLANWDADRQLDVLYPPNHMISLSGLTKYIDWSHNRGEAKQAELIGMSSGKRDESVAQHQAAL
eukprot:SAG31_NODE_6664_length_1934_cov_1.401635_1_plen_367_part_10